MQVQIRVVIANDHRLFRAGIRLILLQQKDVQNVGEAVNGLQTINVVDDLKPDVVLLDIRIPEMDGIPVIPPILQKTQTKAIMLTAGGKKGGGRR